MLKITLSLVTAVVLGVSGDITDKSINISIDDNHSNTNITKNIRVVPTAVININQSSNPDPIVDEVNYDAIDYARGFKNNYLVGEDIKVKLFLKMDSYIYFWTIGSDGKGYLILPNDFNTVKQYRANMEHVIPEDNADYQFVSDRVGVEEVFVLATSKPISFKRIQGIFSSKSGGVVPTASRDSINSFMNKDLKVIAKEEKLNYDISSLQIGVRSPVSIPVPQPVQQREDININSNAQKINININN